MSTSRQGDFDFDVSAWPKLPAARGLFVTATDTEVGKTLITGAIARCLCDRERKVNVFKPVATGCRRTQEGLVSADGEFLAACAGSDAPHSRIVPLRFESPLAPNVAAARERRKIRLNAIFETYRGLAAEGRPILVEGVGGLLCPIADDFWVVHLAKMTALPVVIVARADLGTINHTLLTLHAARSAGLNVAGIVINRYRPDGGEAMRSNPQQISERGRVDVLAVVEEDAESSVEGGRLGRAVLEAVGTVDWEAWLDG